MSSGRSSSRCCRRRSRIGRPEKHPRRAIVDAILYVVRTGLCVAAAAGRLPALADGVLALPAVEAARVSPNGSSTSCASRSGSPTAATRADARDHRLPVRQGPPTPSGRDTRGYDAGKKINGRKRFIVTDTLGLLVAVVRPGRVLAGPRRRQDRPCSPPTWPPRSGTCSPTPGSPAGWSTGPRDMPAHHRGDRPQARRAARLRRASRAGGSWSGPWPGSPPTAAWPATTNATRPSPRP